MATWRSDGLEGLEGYRTDWNERDEIQEWLKDNCSNAHEYQFWYDFYDDLEDCFDDMEPWRVYGEGFIENERRQMRGEEKLLVGYVWASGPYIYQDPNTMEEFPGLASWQPRR